MYCVLPYIQSCSPAASKSAFLQPVAVKTFAYPDSRPVEGAAVAYASLATVTCNELLLNRAFGALKKSVPIIFFTWVLRLRDVPFSWSTVRNRYLTTVLIFSSWCRLCSSGLILYFPILWIAASIANYLIIQGQWRCFSTDVSHRADYSLHHFTNGRISIGWIPIIGIKSKCCTVGVRSWTRVTSV